MQVSVNNINKHNTPIFTKPTQVCSFEDITTISQSTIFSAVNHHNLWYQLNTTCTAVHGGHNNTLSSPAKGWPKSRPKLSDGQTTVLQKITQTTDIVNTHRTVAHQRLCCDYILMLYKSTNNADTRYLSTAPKCRGFTCRCNYWKPNIISFHTFTCTFLTRNLLVQVTCLCDN